MIKSRNFVEETVLIHHREHFSGQDTGTVLKRFRFLLQAKSALGRIGMPLDLLEGLTS